MAATLIVGDFATTAAWADALLSDGHDVETCPHALAFQDRFLGPPADILIIDVTRADSGEAMLISQAQALWPDCGIIATVADYSYRASAIYQMGLWSPDELLLKPVNARILSARVGLLASGSCTRAVRRPGRPARREPAASPVVIDFPPPLRDRAADGG